MDMKNFGCVLILLVVLSSSSIGQPLVRNNRLLLNVDYARFRNDEKSSYLEIYYSLFSGQLRFHREGNHSKAVVALNTELLKQQSGERVAQEHIDVPFILEDTSLMAPVKSLVREAGHLVPTGKYLLNVVAFDSTDPIVSDTITIPIEIDAYSEKTAVSDLELCASIKASTNSQDPFFKNSYEVVPNPTLVFGESKPVLYVYSELYGVDTTKEYVLEHDIIGNDGVVLKKSTRNRRFGVANTLAIGTLNALSLKSGGYWLRFILKETQGEAVTEVKKRFFVNNPSLSTTAISDTTLSSVFSGLTEEEVDKELLQVGYFLTQPERQLLTKLTASEAKRKFLQAFWVRHEATSPSGPPLMRSEFLRRVALANERYTRLGKEGWRTDRGRVLIVYGEPDQIDRHPSESEGKPYETWRYYQLEGGVEFDFLDRNGFGNYELVNSTKRGEIRDDDWQSRR
jgi:GWxTD domain-containing protein